MAAFLHTGGPSLAAAVPCQCKIVDSPSLALSHASQVAWCSEGRRYVKGVRREFFFFLWAYIGSDLCRFRSRRGVVINQGLMEVLPLSTGFMNGQYADRSIRSLSITWHREHISFIIIVFDGRETPVRISSMYAGKDCCLLAWTPDRAMSPNIGLLHVCPHNLSTLVTPPSNSIIGTDPSPRRCFCGDNGTSSLSFPTATSSRNR